jgi:hypothetical protein
METSGESRRKERRFDGQIITSCLNRTVLRLQEALPKSDGHKTPCMAGKWRLVENLGGRSADLMDRL